MRVVSLVPSLTETLRAWGIEPVATTAFCEPVGEMTVGGTKNPDVEQIVGLSPDLVVMDSHENRIEDHRALTAAGIDVVAVEVDSLASLTDQLAIVAEALGLEIGVATEPIGRWSSSPAVPAERSAFIPIWRRPWMTIGGRTYGSAVLAQLGVTNVFGDADGYPEVALADVVERGPDLIIVPSEPYRFRPEHLDELGSVAPVVEVDGQDLFWWGARTPAALQRLAVVLAPAS